MLVPLAAVACTVDIDRSRLIAATDGASAARDGGPSEDGSSLRKDSAGAEGPADDDSGLSDGAVGGGMDATAMMMGRDGGPDRDATRTDVEPAPDATTVDGGCAAGSTLVPSNDANKRFCIDLLEVTNADYRRFLGTPAGQTTAGQIAECAWNRTFMPVAFPAVADNRENYPVVGVDWCDASKYCQAAGKKLCGKIGGGNLPPEEADQVAKGQWVAACSMKDMARSYPYGNTYVANNCNGPGNAGLEAVGSRTLCEGGYPGLRDMSGNAEEWLETCVGQGGGPGGGDGGPGGGGPGGGNSGANDKCVVIGGSFRSATSAELSCQATNINVRRDEAQSYRGFRCCK